ncbi:hypothetical protein KFE25_008497 [Diacronema lutheri]|uniref:AB hydrolase-1 domain-containing protein n=1 Tax=Diacronema lutheri TaxID=2081491 RepID=A0A8J6CGG3_DIALT|nr:hypothetical protein KFE25_008497 [Diacronema lutheri]
MSPSGDFLDGLAARCVPGPTAASAISAVASPTTAQLIVRYLSAALAELAAWGASAVWRSPAAADARARAPPSASIMPVLVGTGSLLGLWLRPWLALVLAVCAALFRSAALLALALALAARMAACDWQLRRSLWHPGPVAPGLYFADTPLNRRRAAFLRASPSLRRERELTRWLWNGDFQTLFPFLAFRAPVPVYRRFWLESPEPMREGGARAVGACSELIALDVALPPGGFDRERPVALVCHGLNGGSGEAYVCDFVRHATEERGWTVVVMVARGLAGTPVRSGQLFHGARTSDLAAAARAVRDSALGAPVVGVGFSMGAIVLANYCGVQGADNPLACAVALSGCYDCVANRHFAYSSAYWQPWLTQQLKTNFCIKQPAAALLGACEAVDLARALSARVRSVTDFDEATVVPFNGYASVDAYYAAMSLAHGGKLSRVAVPLLALHAADDPIVDCGTFAPALRSTTRVDGSEYNPNCWFRITRSGGHVGWNLGRWPPRERWLFMHLSVVDFAEAVLLTAE